MSDKKSPDRFYLLMIAVALLVGILLFGLSPKDLSLKNNVSWLEDRGGIQFRKYGIAFSPAFISSDADGISAAGGFAIELAVKPKAPPAENFGILLAIDNGEDSQQLVVGQWRSWLIVMNGDDYAHKKKSQRLSVNTKRLPAEGFLITIVVDKDGTGLYAEGKPVAVKKQRLLTIPADGISRVIVGNSAYGRNSWRGEVYGLAIYGHRLTDDAVTGHFRQWSSDRHFGFARQSRPLALYLFNEKEGRLAHDQAGSAHLELPHKMRVLRPQLLAPPWQDFEFNTAFIVDAILNFIAFIPFGFILAALFRRNGRFLKAYAFPLAAGLCALTSLFIEITQSWMPSRSSTLLDLILNSGGGWAGALLSKKFSERWLRGIFKP